jgi:hypothetical protein
MGTQSVVQKVHLARSQPNARVLCRQRRFYFLSLANYFPEVFSEGRR